MTSRHAPCNAIYPEFKPVIELKKKLSRKSSITKMDFEAVSQVKVVVNVEFCPLDPQTRTVIQTYYIENIALGVT